MPLNEHPRPWKVGYEYEQFDPGIYISDAKGGIVLAPCGGGACEELSLAAAKHIVESVNAMARALGEIQHSIDRTV